MIVSMTGTAMERLVAAAFVWALLSSGASAQAPANPTANAPPNALQGFSQNRDQPVSIESTTLEVRDKEKLATFLGNVKLVQGDTTLTCATLTVHYIGGPGESGAARTVSTSAMPGGQQRIKRIEAKGGVKVVQKDQVATGDNGIFDMATNTVTLTGNVAMIQGQNVVRGDRLWVDLNSGLSRVESGKSSDGRVRMLITPNTLNKGDKPGSDAHKPSKPAPAPAGASPGQRPRGAGLKSGNGVQ